MAPWIGSDSPDDKEQHAVKRETTRKANDRGAGADGRSGAGYWKSCAAQVVPFERAAKPQATLVYVVLVMLM